jgi:hypothetical protein
MTKADKTIIKLMTAFKMNIQAELMILQLMLKKHWLYRIKLKDKLMLILKRGNKIKGLKVLDITSLEKQLEKVPLVRLN